MNEKSKSNWKTVAVLSMITLAVLSSLFTAIILQPRISYLQKQKALNEQDLQTQANQIAMDNSNIQNMQAEIQSFEDGTNPDYPGSNQFNELMDLFANYANATTMKLNNSWTLLNFTLYPTDSKPLFIQLLYTNGTDVAAKIYFVNENVLSQAILLGNQTG